MTIWPQLALDAQIALRKGQVIPAHPLALDSERRLDERRQRALTRYYLAAGAGGVAVGVHTTQFAIREAGLYAPVLELAASVLAEHERNTRARAVRIAGICGETADAVREAELAVKHGYDIGLLSLTAMRNKGQQELIDHCCEVACVIPLMGWYLPVRHGGWRLSRTFWRAFCEIPAVVAIRIAPFVQYHTLDVIRSVAEVGRAGEIALYTGNDDHVVLDLLTEYRFQVRGETVSQRIAGGVLAHWAFWTSRAVDLLAAVHQAQKSTKAFPTEVLARAVHTTDVNGAVLDAPNDFKGCIPGIHEVLRRQGLLAGTWCLDADLCASPGQRKEIDRVCAAYPHLNDDAFVAQNLDDWMR